MVQLWKTKLMICRYIIIREWIENGEFSKVDQIVVVGSRVHVFIVKFLFRKSGKKVYYSKSYKKYKYSINRKWIIFDKGLKKLFLQNDSNILLVP